MKRTLKKPELMSPAGYWPQVHTAIEAGADAVYFGLQHFSARAKVGFSLNELPELMRTLHARAVKGFVTFNTLVFDHELTAAQDAIIAIAEAGCDAIIVQDVGIARLAKQIAPELEVHGSTQMSITSAQGAELARSLGCNRVVLGRELSLQDMRRIAQATDVELEVFVHGALCVSYSGQCFSSEAWGGRSANRGQCAQACRLSYDLIVDDNPMPLKDARYLLSPGDLYALKHIPELIDIGIDTFKIEGRYKDADYVALTTKAYRTAIDDAMAGLELSVSEDEERALAQVYSRGLGDYFVSGTNHQRVVRGRAPRHRGVQVGQVVRVHADAVDVRFELPLKPGDGLVFDAADWRSPDEPEEGGRIYELMPLKNDTVRLKFATNAIAFTRIRKGDLVWRTYDADVKKQARVFTDTHDPLYTRPLSLVVVANAGDYLHVTATSDDGLSVSAQSDALLEPAKKRALDEAFFQEHLGKLGGSAFHLADLTLVCDDELFMPVSSVNRLRRDLVEQLMTLRTTRPERHINDAALSALLPAPKKTPAQNTHLTTPRLHVLVRTPEQLDAALDQSPDSITLDYLELYGLKPSVQRVKDAGIHVRVASPRILKPSEQNILKFLTSLNCELLVRSGGLLQDLLELPDDMRPAVTGDFSLNIANVLSARTFLDKGVRLFTPTHDLNAQQTVDLAQGLPDGTLEVIAYQHLPVFHTEHCVFCRFLSEGTDYTNCGHPCEQHKLALKDKSGRVHPVMADVGCRNTVFGAQAQSSGKHVRRWLDAGIRDYRIEFVHESAGQVQAVTGLFKRFFTADMSVEAFDAQLAKVAPQGATEGSLFIPADFSELPQLL